MSFNLTKATENAKFTLEKKGVTSAKAQVVSVLDVSGSAQGLFSSGQMQEAWQAILPIGINLDLDGDITTYIFATEGMEQEIKPPANKDNFSNYLKNYVLSLPKNALWGRTDYCPVMKKLVADFGFYKGLFSKKLQKFSNKNQPVIVYYFTDGANDDKAKTKAFLAECEAAETQVYFMFIGIGDKSNFTFIEECGEKFGNVGFASISNLSQLTGDNVYDTLVPDELTTWLKK